MGVEVISAFPSMLVVPFYPRVGETNHPHLLVLVEVREYSRTPLQPDVLWVSVQITNLVRGVPSDNGNMKRVIRLHRQSGAESVYASYRGPEDAVFVVVARASVDFHSVKDDWLMFCAVQ